MPSRTLPNLGLKGFYDLGEDGWKDEQDLNLLTLSVLTQGTVLSKVAAEPGAPADGDVHILDETHGTNPNEIAIRDDGAWVYIEPSEGWLLYNVDGGYYEKFDGAVWDVFSPGSSGVPDGIAFPGSPADNDLFFRTDRDMIYSYDTAAGLWLSMHRLTVMHGQFFNAGADQAGFCPIPYKGIYDLWIERFDASVFRNSGGEWDFIFGYTSAANVFTAVASLDGAGDTTANWYAKGTNIGAVLHADARTITFQADEISGSSGFYGQGMVTCRLVG